MKNKEHYLEIFIELARKLNKIPTVADCLKYGITRNMIRHNFGNYTSMRNEALEKVPDLEIMTQPAQLVVEDVINLRHMVDSKKVKSQNAELVKSVNTLEYISQFAENVFSGKITPVKPVVKKSKTKRDLHILLSDHHYGSDLKKEEVGIDFGTVEESRRMAFIVKEVCEYKIEHRNETKLHVHLLGDMIENKLHDPQDAAPLTEQVCRAIHILSQSIAHFGENFKEVEVHCTTGNHGRSLSRHQKRATSAKWDSIETVIYYALKHALSNYKNVTFNIPKTPFYVVNSLGSNLFATHGDTVINPGNPGKSINMANLEKQINRINASVKDVNEYKVVVMGHVHISSVTTLNNGVTIITNGPLCPPNGFANSIGILEGDCSQTLFETVEGYPVGDIRFIKVGPKQDKNKALDKIIKPWRGI
jgi:predicted phosphodiesterase/uncharacterized protein YbaA (DUF1428 family)